MTFYEDIGNDVEEFFSTDDKNSDYDLGQTFSFKLKNGAQKVELEKTQDGGFVKYAHGALSEKFGGNLGFKVKANSSCAIDLKKTKVLPGTTDWKFDTKKTQVTAKWKYSKDNFRVYVEPVYTAGPKQKLDFTAQGTGTKGDACFGVSLNGSVPLAEKDASPSLKEYGAAMQYNQPKQNAVYSLVATNTIGEKGSSADLVATCCKKVDDDCTAYARLRGAMPTEEDGKKDVSFMAGARFSNGFNIFLNSEGGYNALYSYKLSKYATGSMSYNNTLSGGEGTIGWKLAFQ